MRTLTVPIQAGRLRLTCHREEWPLEQCVTYATRQNPRRLYMFVSKVLGKHWPAQPRLMQQVHQQLAAKIAHLPGPLLVMGLAETATALGRGVAEVAAAHTGREDILYMQTTRCRLSRPLAFAFDEAHSHAPDHAVYLPEPPLQAHFQAARSLVVVDDEISTGRTLRELVAAYLRINPQVGPIALASITCWLSAARQRELSARLGRPVAFPALIEGEFCFEANPEWPPPVLPAAVVDLALHHDAIVSDPARTGVLAGGWRVPAGLLERIRAKIGGTARRLSVIGVGEYLYPPFRIALALEQAGYNVHYQSTTRSPMLPGDAIISRREFPDHQDVGIPNYLYNLDPERLPLVIYEHPALLATHSLAGEIGALAFAVEDTCRVS